MYDESFKHDATEKRTKSFELVQCKAIDEGNGGFMAYVTTWGNVDRGGERVVRGATMESIESFKRDGWLAVGHDWVSLGAGYVKEAREDDYGLWVEFAFHGDDDSQAVRRKVIERINAGKSVSVSIGYYLIDWKVVDGVLELHKIDLKEVSIVNVPMNPMALATGVKAFDGMTIESEGEIVMQGVKHLIDRLTAREEARVKESRELSSGNVAMIDGIVTNLEESAIKLRELADRNRKGTETEPTTKTSEAEALEAWKAERYRMQFESELYS